MANRYFTLGDREIDLERATVRGPSGEIPLTSNEVKLLSVLAETIGQVVSRDDLLRAALGYNKAVTSRAIDQAVWRLRRKIEEEPHQPRWLLSEANVGYRLVLTTSEPPKGVHTVRERERERLITLLAQHSRVLLVGLPGTGRQALVESVAAKLEGGGRRIEIAQSMPMNTALPVLRLGPLPREVSTALLIGAVLSARGEQELSEDEEGHAAMLAEMAGDHLGTLLALARSAAVSHLRQLHSWEPDPSHVALIEALSPEIRRALQLCSVFPDPFTPAQAGLSADLIGRAWRALVLDAVDTDDGERRFIVPPCIRALVTPDLPARAAFVSSVIEQVTLPALAALDGLDQDRIAAVVKMSRRLERANALASPKQQDQLLPALLVLVIATGQLPESLPAPRPDQDPSDALTAHLLRAHQLERTDPREAHASALTATSYSSSPLLEATALRAAFRLAVASGCDAAVLDPLLSRIDAVCERDSRPFLLATRHHLRGLYLLRAGSTDAAREELVAALALYGERSVAARLVLSNLAAEAARDGRALEALAWTERVDVAALPPAEEARERLRRSSILLVTGDLDAAERELAMAEMLGASTQMLSHSRAICALLRGKIEDAIVLVEASMSQSPERDFAHTMVLGWARLIQGMPEQTLQLIERSTAVLSHADYQAQLDLLRVCALARAGRIEEADAAMSAISAPARRWWEPTLAAVRALVSCCAGAQTDARSLEQEIERGGIIHLVTRFALVAMRLRGDQHRVNSRVTRGG